MEALTCSQCNQTFAEHYFYADTKTGISKLCRICRQRNQWRIKKQRQRKYQKLLAKADTQLKKDKENLRNAQIKQLIKEFKAFTLPNRNRLKELEKRASKREENSERTRLAILARKNNQQKAEAILKYQIALISAGLKTRHISDLWREQNGDDPRGESQEID